ncbi:MAG: Endolytic peptidoglycan transglycosylase RlpA [Paracidovorax wautersii]|uniref:Endolytic peptidoglycan transglycosylase RlpA n=1 Tax=Paracidovorax wautersii TaxID=1177982 RepID=A0A7V8JPI7_9BURK|nr:MAG: Endolytic peptidoglycan transglycosylase RlpA [Paracidovorax wautersii]
MLVAFLAAAGNAQAQAQDQAPTAEAGAPQPSVVERAGSGHSLVARMGNDHRKTFDPGTNPVFRRSGGAASAFDPDPVPVPAADSAPAAVAAKPASRTAELVREASARIAEQANARGARDSRQASLSASLASGQVGVRQRGVASWYSNNLHGELTANGERYNRFEMTAAHQTLPLGSWVKVTRVGSQRSVLVRVNDRGPFAKSRIIDLSYQAAQALGMINTGTAQVVMEVVSAPQDSGTVASVR